MEVHVPKVCMVETDAVVRRLASKSLAARVSNGVMKSYNVLDEEAIFNTAWDMALEPGCSGFHSYFIAMARRVNFLLFQRLPGASGKG